MANKEASLLLRIKTAGEEAIDKVQEGLGKIATVGLAAFGALSAAIVKGVGEYAQQEQAINALTRTMVNNGVYSKELKQAYLDQADALSKVTLFGDEQIVQAQAAFSQQARGITLTKEATSAILDFAQAQGMDVAQAAEVVGKSIGTSTNALARYGIEVSSTATKSEKMAQVLQGLNNKFGGQAEAATGGLGSLQLLSKSVGELFESLGARLAPTITLVAQNLNQLVGSATQVDSFINAIGDGFNFVTKLATSVIFAFQSVGTTIGATFGTIAGSLSLLVDGQFAAAKDALVSGFDDLAKERERIATEHNAKIQELDNANFQSKIAQSQQEEQLLVQSLQRKNEIVQQDRLSAQERDLQNLIEDSNIKNQMELALISGRQSAIYAAEVAAADRRYQLATTQAQKTAALADKYRAIELENQAKTNEAKLQATKDVLSQVSTIQNSSNRHLAALGKAAALTQIAIEGPVAITRALASAPPPFNFALAAGVGAAIATQVANVSGVALAEGGIVMPRVGGTQATIGEAGQPEAVIPLDRFSEFGMGGGGTTVVINVQGGMLGSESEAREFALAVDKELLKLRRNNESVSFDSGVI